MKIRSIMVSVLLLSLLAGPAAAEWAGKELTKDGVLYVQNPEKPVTSIKVEPKYLWERGGDDEEILFGLPSQIVVDGEGNIYILDGQLSEIQVLSPDGEFLRTVGREGEGPGEFQNVSDMYLGGNGLLGIVRIFPGRIFQIGTDGTPADHFPLPDPGGFQLVHIARAAKDRVVVAMAVTTGGQPEQIQTTSLKAFDYNGRELAEYCRVETKTRFGGMQFDEKIFSDFARRWALDDGGRAAVNLVFDDYTINVYNSDGSLDRVIERPDHQLLNRSSRDVDRFQKLFDGVTRYNPGSTFKVSKTHSAVANLWFRPDGSLWIASNRALYDPADGLFTSIDEFDQQGRFVRRIDLVMEGNPVEDGIFIIGGRLYLVTDLFGSFMASLAGGDAVEEEEDQEPLRLIAYDLNMD